MSHREDAIKHALIALGGALQLFNMADLGSDTGPMKAEIEMFTVRQYTKAISKLKESATLPTADRIGLTLLCCLAFVNIEALRNNHREALIHLENGMRIIESMPLESLSFLRQPNARYKSSDKSLASSEMDYVIRQFACWELSASLFAENFKPVLCIKLYQAQKFHQTLPVELTSLFEVHNSVTSFGRDAISLAWETKSHKGDVEFWSQPEIIVQHDILKRRAERLKSLISTFLSRPDTPKAGSLEYCSFQVDLVHFKCCHLIADLLPASRDLPPPQGITARFAEVVSIVSWLQQAIKPTKDEESNCRTFRMDVGIVAPLYFVVSNCRDRDVQRRALCILRDWPRRENLWDGPAVRKLFRTVENVKCGPRHPLSEVPIALTFSSGIPALYEKLAELQIEVAEG